MQPPKWFANWSTEFEKRNNARWDKQEKFNEQVLNRLDNLVKKNNLTE
jgi:hypothetical protein